MKIMRPARKIRHELYATEGADGVWWLGNAGFAIRLGHRYVFIDPAVTDRAHSQTRRHGFPLEPSEFERADHVLYTHEHSDHMDRGLFPRLVQLESDICAPEYCKRFLLQEGILGSQVRVSDVGATFAGQDYEIEVTRAVHCSGGHLYYAEEADQDKVSCGYLIKTKHGNILHPGDSCYLGEMADLAADYLLLPINDTNLGVGFAAQLTEELQPKVVIPCHYGMYAPPRDWQGGHPAEYVTALAARQYDLPHTDIMILAPGGKVFL